MTHPAIRTSSSTWEPGAAQVAARETRAAAAAAEDAEDAEVVVVVVDAVRAAVVADAGAVEDK